MLRTITITIAVLAVFSGTAAAADLSGRTADNQAQSAIRYECTQIKQAETGFSCSLDKMRQYGMQIHWVEDTQKMTKERRAAAMYARNAMTVRFYQVGGSTVTITSDDWGNDKAKQCHPTKSRQSEICFLCSGKDEHGSWKCE